MKELGLPQVSAGNLPLVFQIRFDVCIEHLDTWWVFGVFVLVSRSRGKKSLTWTKSMSKQREDMVGCWMMMRRSLTDCLRLVPLTTKSSSSGRKAA